MSETTYSLRVERTFEAPRESVFRAWTEPDLVMQWFHPSKAWSTSVADTDLRVGGAYEWFQGLEPDERGRRGGAGARILSFVPQEMLAFDWTFPPSIPSLRSGDAKTQVIVRFTDRGERGVAVSCIEALRAGRRNARTEEPPRRTPQADGAKGLRLLDG